MNFMLILPGTKTSMACDCAERVYQRDKIFTDHWTKDIVSVTIEGMEKDMSDFNQDPPD